MDLPSLQAPIRFVAYTDATDDDAALALAHLIDHSILTAVEDGAIEISCAPERNCTWNKWPVLFHLRDEGHRFIPRGAIELIEPTPRCTLLAGRG